MQNVIGGKYILLLISGVLFVGIISATAASTLHKCKRVVASDFWFIAGRLEKNQLIVGVKSNNSSDLIISEHTLASPLYSFCPRLFNEQVGVLLFRQDAGGLEWKSLADPLDGATEDSIINAALSNAIDAVVTCDKVIVFLDDKIESTNLITGKKQHIIFDSHGRGRSQLVAHDSAIAWIDSQTTYNIANFDNEKITSFSIPSGYELLLAMDSNYLIFSNSKKIILVNRFSGRIASTEFDSIAIEAPLVCGGNIGFASWYFLSSRDHDLSYLHFAADQPIVLNHSLDKCFVYNKVKDQNNHIIDSNFP